jgi:hypothetical protein
MALGGFVALFFAAYFFVQRQWNVINQVRKNELQRYKVAKLQGTLQPCNLAPFISPRIDSRCHAP